MKLNKNLLVNFIFIIFGFISFIKVLEINTNFFKFDNLTFEKLDNSVGFHSESNKWVLKNYYSELTRGFFSGKFGFEVEPHEELFNFDNPYGTEAASSGFIIQDASLYQGEYYLYYGFAPVVIFYAPIYILSNSIPSDALVLSIMFVIYLFGFYLVYKEIYKKTLNLYVPIFFLVAFLSNIFILTYFTWSFSSGVSRIFCFTNTLFICYLVNLAYFQKEAKNIFQKNALLLLFLLISLNAITRPSYLIDYLFIIFLVGSNLSKFNRYGSIRFSFLISLLIFTLNFLYNFIRFDNIFENGQKYITNGLDFVNNGSLFQFPSSLYQVVYNFFHRIYDFFFIPPAINGDSLLVNFQLFNGVMLKNPYSEGLLGFTYLAPVITLIVFVLYYQTFKHIISQKIFLMNTFTRPDTLFLVLSLLIILLFSFVPSIHWAFGSEIIPRLLACCFFSILLNKNNIFKNNLFLLFGFVLIMISLEFVFRNPCKIFIYCP